MTEEERKLLDACLQGGADARERLYRRYAPFLLTAIRFCSIPGMEPMDILHDAFIKIFEGLPRFARKDDGSLMEWMKRITMNTMADAFRRSRLFRRADLEQLPALEEGESGELGGARISMEEISRLAKDLPERQRVVFGLRYFSGWSHKMIAERLHIQERTSASLLAHAHAGMRTLLNDYFLKHR